METFHNKRINGDHPVDYASSRVQMASYITSAGGYDQLSDGEKLAAAQWYLIEDSLESRLQFEKLSQKAFLAAKVFTDAALADLTIGLEAKAKAEESLSDAVVHWDNQTDPALLATRNTTRDTYNAAYAEAEVQNAAVKTARTARDFAKNLILNAQDAKTEEEWTTEMTNLSGQVDDKQTELAADPDNVALQDELTTLENALSYATEKVDQHQAVATTQAAYDAVLVTRTAALQAQETAKLAFDAAQKAIESVYSQKYASDMLPLWQQKLDAELKLADVKEALVASPDDVTLLTEEKDLVSAIALEESKIASQQIKVNYQNAMTIARNVYESRNSALSNALRNVETKQRNYDQVKVASDALDKTSEEWVLEADKEESKWSNHYHDNMVASRTRRLGLVATYTYRELGLDAAQATAARLISVHDLYKNWGIKGIREGNAQEGLWDYLYSHAGTSFEGDGLLESGYTPRSGTLEDVRTRVLKYLEEGQ